MKKTIKKRDWMFGLLGASCAMGLMIPPRAAAEVSDADFKALQETVQKLSNQVQGLEQTNFIEQQTHEQDVEQLKQLQDKLSQTQQTAQEAEQKSAAVSQAQSQPVLGPPIDEATVNHNFMMLGDAEFQYDKVQGQHGSFLLADFAPIFLYRGGDDVLFEAGFDTTLANNAPGSPGYTTTFNLSFAQLDYVMNDYMTLAVGDLLLPLGTYSQRGAGWLNLIPDDPLAVDALLPGSGIGAELLGAIPLGNDGDFLNYTVYGANGPSSADGTGDAGALDLGGNVGLRSDGVTANLHSDPSGGARVGIFLPFPYKPHYDLELGVSGQSGEWDNSGNHLWSAGVLDAALHLGSSLEAKGEFITTAYGSDDMGLVRQRGMYAQVGYKLAGLNLNLPVINNVELMGRYDFLHDGLGTSTRRYSMGYVYYITSTFLFEGDYEIFNSSDPTQPRTQLIFQLSYGF
jgi:hypothetical protein